MEPISNYKIAVGEPDTKRLDALGAIYNPTSMSIISSHGRRYRPAILDVGCGNGSLTNLYAKTFKGSHIVAIDNNRSQLDISEKTAGEEGLTNISWKLCDVYKLSSLEEDQPRLFDVVHSRFVLTHLTNPEKAADEMLYMVKPGGVLIIEESGAKKRFKGIPPKCIEAWSRMVEIQYKAQKSYKDTCDRVYAHIKNSTEISSCKSEYFDILITGQLQKSLFRMGAEQGLKKFIDKSNIQELGYEDGETWLKELKAFEEDDSKILEVENYQCLIVTKKQNVKF